MGLFRALGYTQMIVGTGIDIAEVDRIAASIERFGRRFLERVFTPDEIRYCESKANKAERYAGRFAAKEAAMKAIGTGWSRGVTWQDVEVTRVPGGRPTVTFHRKGGGVLSPPGRDSRPSFDYPHQGTRHGAGHPGIRTAREALTYLPADPGCRLVVISIVHDRDAPNKSSAQRLPAQLSARSASLAVGLMSFSALLLELGLTRLFSVVLFYHFAFLAISIALLGLGAGAVFAFLRREWLERWSIGELGTALCAANALIILGALEVVLHSSVAMHLDWANFGRLTVLYLAAAVPFFITGLLFSIVFARHPARITQLYGADLLGGSLACLALVPLLNFIGGPNTILFAAVAVALAGVAWARSRARWMPAVLALLLLALIAVNFRGKLIDIVYAKGMKRAAPLFAKWNALSRVEVDEQGWAKVIVIDADASTYLMNTDPHHWDARYQRDLMSAAPALVNVLRPKGDYAIIGPGGGVDVLRAVANGSPSVTGIEINPIIAMTSCATASRITPTISMRFPRCTSTSAMAARSFATAATSTTWCR